MKLDERYEVAITKEHLAAVFHSRYEYLYHIKCLCIVLTLGRFGNSVKYYQEAITMKKLIKESKNIWDIARTFNNFGQVLLDLGQKEKATNIYLITFLKILVALWQVNL